MKGQENLKPLTERSTEERREIQRAGGRASVAARRKKKELREVVKMILDGKELDKDGKNTTRREQLALAMVRKGIKGDVKAAELTAKLAGEMPDPKQQLDVNVSGNEAGNRPVLIKFVDSGDDGCSRDQ